MMDTIQQAARMVREDPSTVPYVFREGLTRFSSALKMAISSRMRWGFNIYDEDWDLLIILDTCRIDALRYFNDDFHFLKNSQFESRISPGGATLEWLSNTFTSHVYPEIKKTAYLSGNPWTDLIFERGARPEDHLNVPWAPTTWDTVDVSDFAYFDNVWRRAEETNPITDHTRPDPEFMSDAAIQVGRNQEFERMIIHFIQPHSPYIENALSAGRKQLQQYESKPFDYLRKGGARETVWNAYLSELETTLHAIETLLSNFDAQEVVISADHGEAIGEYSVYGHRSGSIHPKVRIVPWIRTTARDRRTHNPIKQTNESLSDNQIKRQLESLGYM